MNNTKIIATIGPNISDIDTLKELFDSGADVARINMSYADEAFCLDIIKKLEKINKENARKMALMLDIAGPNVRINDIDGGEAYLEQGDKIRIYMDKVLGDKTKFSLNYNIIDDIKVNDTIKIRDGKITLKVIDKDTSILCEVIVPGKIETGNNLNVIGKKLNIPFLSEKDKNNIRFACQNKVDFLSLSFVSSLDDVLEVNDMLIEMENDHLEIIAKIETEHAFEEIDEIIKASDGIMVARGDLGVNVPIERVPIIQKTIINKCHEYGKISIVSTEFLSSMENDLMPTRAEVSDVANAVIDGTDAILLADEVAKGNYPVQTLKMMEKIIGTTESSINTYHQEILDEQQDITGSVAYSVVECAKKLDVKAIVAPTMSGYTAIKLSKFRPNCPIVALSPNIETVKNLTLHYGVHPIHIETLNNFDDIIKVAKENAKYLFKINEKDRIIITGGYPFSKVKHTNFMKIEEL